MKFSSSAWEGGESVELLFNFVVTLLYGMLAAGFILILGIIFCSLIFIISDRWAWYESGVWSILFALIGIILIYLDITKLHSQGVLSGVGAILTLISLSYWTMKR